MKILDIDPNDMYFFNLRGTAPWSKLGHAKLGLLRTCRQIHEEATQVFWSTNCIEIFDATLLVKFANETDLKHLAMIKKLRLHFPRKASSGADSQRFFGSGANTLDLRNALKKTTAFPSLRIALEHPGFVNPNLQISMSGFEAVQLQTVVKVMLPGDLIEAEDLKMVQQICEHRKIAIGQYRTILALRIKTAEIVLQELLLACVDEMILKVRCQVRS